MSDKEAQAVALKAQNPTWGYIRIAQEMGWDKNRVRRAIEHAERKASKPANGVLRYDVARQAIAEAVSFDEVRDWEDKAAAIKEYGRRIGDRTMVINALAIQADSRRRRGQLLLDLKDRGQLTEGRRKTILDAGELKPVTLEQLGITANESARDQKIASIDGDSYERLIQRCRTYMEQHPEKHSMDVLRAQNGPINGARSVMGDRQEPNESLDFFPTPPWATRALLTHVLPTLRFLAIDRIWEPACGQGHISEVLREGQGDDGEMDVWATDVFDYGAQDEILDFLNFNIGESESAYNASWIITNPPFGDKAVQFVLRALDLASVGVAMFFRSQWAVEGVDRYESIFRDHPPTLCAYFVERVPLCKGEWKPHGTTATAYCWLVWIKGEQPRPPFWIPPGCRKMLTRPDDIARFAPQYLDAAVEGEIVDSETGEIAEEAA